MVQLSHHHSGIAGFTPEQVFTQRHLEVAEQKQRALDAMYAAKPDRFVRGRPTVAMPPAVVTINPITAEERENGVADTVNFSTLPSAKLKNELSLN